MHGEEIALCEQVAWLKKMWRSQLPVGGSEVMSQGQSFVSKLQGGDVLYFLFFSFFPFFLLLGFFFSSALFAFLCLNRLILGQLFHRIDRIVHVGEHL